jgi:hypothetical protein
MSTKIASDAKLWTPRATTATIRPGLSRPTRDWIVGASSASPTRAAMSFSRAFNRGTYSLVSATKLLMLSGDDVD